MAAIQQENPKWILVFIGGPKDGLRERWPCESRPPAELHKNSVEYQANLDKAQVHIGIYQLERRDETTDPRESIYRFQEMDTEAEYHAARAKQEGQS